MGALVAPISMALTCRWRSRPQHQKPTHALTAKAWQIEVEHFQTAGRAPLGKFDFAKKSVEKKTVSIAGFLIYPSLWAIIVYGAVMHIRSVRPQANRALFFGREKPFRKFQEQPRSLRD